MKFKYIMMALGIIIVVVIAITALLPLVLTGTDFAASFRFLTLPLMIFMALLLVCLSFYFLLNYRLFSLLEREDWPALSYYLEHKLFVSNRYSARKVRILAGSYLVMSDFASVFKLENKALHSKPSTVYKNILIFGSARILSGKYQEAAEFFRANIDKSKSVDKNWIRWFYGFSLLLFGAFKLVEPEYQALAVSSKDALITGLSAYFLDTSIAKYSPDPEVCKKIAESGRFRVLKAIKNEAKWKNELEKMGDNMHVAIIKKYIDETGDWLFPPIVEEDLTEDLNGGLTTDAKDDSATEPEKDSPKKTTGRTSKKASNSKPSGKASKEDV